VSFIFLTNDIHTQLNAFITDEYGRTSNQFAYLMLRLATKRAIESVFRITAGGLVHRPSKLVHRNFIKVKATPNYSLLKNGARQGR
jgi:2',3'-cyclic-nucleotide 2'-phosphodiesterase (5'-nucleotidase family)